MLKTKLIRGSVLAEAMVATSIFLVVIIGLANTLSFVIKNALENPDKIKATYLAEEGLEAVRFLRDQSWSNISGQAPDAPFYLVFDGSVWTISGTPALIDGEFERAITLENVYRDGSGSIASSGGTLDPNTKKVIATVSWTSRGTVITRSLSTYITNALSY